MEMPLVAHSLPTQSSELIKCDNGALRFQVKSSFGNACLSLNAHKCHKLELYKIYLGPESKIIYSNNPSQNVSQTTPQIIFNNEFQEFWLTWYNGIICVGLKHQRQPFIKLNTQDIQRDEDEYIGFVKCYNILGRHCFEWRYESPPVIEKVLNFKEVEGGKLRWVKLINNRLPPDAMIGGFEYEPIYIARSYHLRSLCPGKYIPSLRTAFVPWGHEERAKSDCEILCGYDAKWVKTYSNRIPENAFIGGTSEVRNEPLYIGRAMIDGHLIVGKVHLLYNTCYLPYNGREHERHSYEILVRCDLIPRSIAYPMENEG